MSEKPILFSAEMVRAILDGRKTQTRRIIKPTNKTKWLLEADWSDAYVKNPENYLAKNCPYGQPGDLLWVRETWGLYDTEPKDGQENAIIFYRASDGDNYELRYQLWRPSIFMPRWASRITLKIADVRVERLQDISEQDALKEGVPADDDFPVDKMWCWQCGGQGVRRALGENYGVTEIDCPDCDTAKKRFMNLWDSINSKRGYSWSSNPWVWVIEFTRKDGKTI